MQQEIVLESSAADFSRNMLQCKLFLKSVESGRFWYDLGRNAPF